MNSSHGVWGGDLLCVVPYHMTMGLPHILNKEKKKALKWLVLAYSNINNKYHCCGKMPYKIKESTREKPKEIA
jgi:hypothetical protein